MQLWAARRVIFKHPPDLLQNRCLEADSKEAHGREQKGTCQPAASRRSIHRLRLGAPSARADSSRSFAGLLTQLQQAAEQPVQHIDGKTYLPTHIYFFTPEPVDTRTLQTRFEAYQSLRHRGVKIVDGHELAELLAPELSPNCRKIAGPSPPHA